MNDHHHQHGDTALGREEDETGVALADAPAPTTARPGAGAGAGAGSGVIAPAPPALRPTGARGWRLALPATIACLLALVAFFWPTVHSLVRIWQSSDTYAHGMLVAPIVLLMIWSRRRHLATLTPRPGVFGLLAMAGFSALWLVAHTADVLVVQQFAFVALLPALVYALLGRAVFVGLLFPLCYLFFAVPVGEELVPPLQYFTANFAVEALQLSGIPVLMEGFYITLPSKHDPLAWDHFQVAEACSGVRYLIASVALGCLYAYLTYRSVWRRAAFIGLSLVFPIIANGIRAYGIIMIAHHSSMELAVGADHLLYGWLFFGLVIGLLFWIGSWWREPPVAAASVRPPSPGSADRGGVSTRGAGPLATGATAAAALAVIGLTSAVALQLHNGDDHRPVRLPAPAARDGWQGPSWVEPGAVRERLRWQPRFNGADAELMLRYRLDIGEVVLYIAHYRQEGQGAELINSQNRLFDGDHWRQIDRRPRRVGDLPVVRLQLDGGGDNRVLYYWYRVAGQPVTSPLRAKLLRAWDQLGGGRQGSTVVAVATDAGLRTPAENEALLIRFVEAMRPAVEAALRQAQTDPT